MQQQCNGATAPDKPRQYYHCGFHLMQLSYADAGGTSNYICNQLWLALPLPTIQGIQVSTQQKYYYIYFRNKDRFLYIVKPGGTHPNQRKQQSGYRTTVSTSSTVRNRSKQHATWSGMSWSASDITTAVRCGTCGAEQRRIFESDCNGWLYQGNHYIHRTEHWIWYTVAHLVGSSIGSGSPFNPSWCV